MKFRKINKWYANMLGYFWIPCPICGNNFGGHEWKLKNTLEYKDSSGKGVCSDCGEEARKRNRKIYKESSLSYN